MYVGLGETTSLPPPILVVVYLITIGGGSRGGFTAGLTHLPPRRPVSGEGRERTERTTTAPLNGRLKTT